MPFPSRLLGPDEHVIVDTHPHWKRLIAPAVVFIATAGVGSYLVTVVPDWSLQRWLRIAIAVVALLVIVSWSIRPWLGWLGTRYTLTNERVVLRDGVLTRRGRDIPLNRVNDVAFHHTLLERVLGCGTLTIESAGDHGQVVLYEVPEVEFMQRAVYDAVAGFRP